MNEQRLFPASEGSNKGNSPLVKQTRHKNGSGVKHLLCLILCGVFLWETRTRLDVTYSEDGELLLHVGNIQRASAMKFTGAQTNLAVDDESPKKTVASTRNTRGNESRNETFPTKGFGAAASAHASSKETLSSHAERAKRKKPLLILHVGPHKTATSATQCQLTHHRKLLLNKTSHVYVGRSYRACLGPNEKKKYEPFDPRDIVKCIDRLGGSRDGKTYGTCNQDSPEWEAVDKVLLRLSRKGLPVIISDEAFARVRHNMTAATAQRGSFDSPPHRALYDLLSRHYDVKVVVGYRRYHEWVVSFHHHSLRGRLEKGKWPLNHSVRRGYIENFPNRDYAYVQSVHPTEYLAKLYSSSGFENVVVFDLHRKDDEYGLLGSFFQQISLWDGSGKNSSGSNESKNEDVLDVLQAMKTYVPDNPNTGWHWKTIQLRLLAAAVQRWNLSGGSEKKKESQQKRDEKKIFNAIAEKVRESGSMPPLDCLTPDEEEAFLRKSLAMERQLFSMTATGPSADPNKITILRYDDRAMEESENRHHAEFAGASRHCNVDITRMRNDTEWLEFFRNL